MFALAHRTASAYQLPSVQSVNFSLTLPVTSGEPAMRYRTVTSIPRVRAPFGPKFVSLRPFMKFLSVT